MTGKWNYRTKQYDPYILPDGASAFEYEMDKIIQCASCSENMEYGDGYTSLEIHNSVGLGFSVCEKCYSEERERGI